MKSRLLLLALAGVAALGACGRRGDLQQPAPLFGEKARADYEAQQRARETTRSEADEEDARAPVPNPNDRFEPASRNVPATQEPIEGSSNPIGARPNNEQTPRRPGAVG